MSPRRAGIAAAAVSLAFGAVSMGDGHAQTSRRGIPSLSSAPALTASDLARNERLRAASEPFEKLTEISFDQDLTTIDQTISEAQKSVAELGNALSGEAAQQVGQQLSALRTGREKADRVALALSSIEIYRLLVTAAAPGSKVPNEVYLLDYAGFRCNADLKAVPVRWEDMAQAASFARASWAVLLPMAERSPISARFSKALADIEQSVAQRDAPLAAAAVKAELDLVDELETFFAAK